MYIFTTLEFTTPYFNFHLLTTSVNAKYQHCYKVTWAVGFELSRLLVNELTKRWNNRKLQGTPSHGVIWAKIFYLQIHTRQWSCNSRIASCNCGVAIKEQSHYAIYDMCNQDDLWWKNGGGILLKRSSPNAIASGFFSAETSTGGLTMDYDVSTVYQNKIQCGNRIYWIRITDTRANKSLIIYSDTERTRIL